MAKVTYIDLLPEDIDLYYKNLQAGERFVNSTISRKSLLLSDAKKIDLAGRSLFGFLGGVWGTYDSTLKNNWKSAGSKVNLSNWQLFIKDSAYRIRQGMSGYATPNDLHQAGCGNLHIESPATELKIVQLHPASYYIKQKVVGKKGQYDPVFIQESLYLPLELKLNYKSNLTSAGAGSFAKFYARVHHLYQGTDLYTNLEITIDLISDWKSATETLATVTGLAVDYTLYIHLYNVTGDLYIDHLEANHSGENWARDSYCYDINEGFTKEFYQVPKNWAGVIVPEGAEYESIYKDF